MKLPIAPAVLVAVSLGALAQDAKFDVVGALARGKCGSERFDAKLVFENASALIFLHAKLGERTCNVLLDTGAPMTVTPELAKELKLETLGKFKTNDSTGHAQELEFVALPAIEIGTARYTELVAIVVDLRALPELRALGIDGLIGSNLLRLGTLAIDYVGKTLELADSSAKFDMGSAASFDFTTSVQGTPYFSLKVGSTEIPRIKLDTGANSFLHLPASIAEGLASERTVDVLGNTTSGVFGKSREGSRMVWLTDVSLGNTKLNAMVAEALPDGEACLGNRFFERTRIVLNWRDKTMLVAEPSKLGQAQLRTHGLGLKFEDGAVRVAKVIAKSPAARAKLAPEQRVLTVGEIDLRDGTLANYLRAADLLRDDARDAIEVSVEIDGKPVTVKLDFERLLPR